MKEGEISATAVSAAGAQADPRYPMDGEDLAPYLKGLKPDHDRRLFWRHHGFPRPGIPEQGAHLSGLWKYYVSGEYERLYKLADDPHELHDLKEIHREVFGRLKADYQKWAAQMLPYKELHE